MSRTLLLSLAVSTALSTTTAFAEEGKDNEIVVTATGFSQAREDVGQAITIIDRERLDTLQTATISDVLATVPGVNVARTGGPGSVTSVFIRGANSGQTLVLVDGVRINDPSSPNGLFDFGSMLTGNIDRVEVLRGPNSIVWGSQAIGGVVDIRNAMPTDGPALRAGVEYGSHDTKRMNANVGTTAGAIAASLGVSYYKTDGISALSADPEKDGYRNVALNGRVTVKLTENIGLDLRGYFNHGKVSVDDPFAFSALSDPKTDTEHYVLYAGVTANFLDDRFQNRIGYSRTDIDATGTDPEPFSFYVSQAYGKLDRLEYRGSLDLADPVRLVFGAEHEKSEARTAYGAGSPFDSATNEVTSFYGQAILKPVTGLTLTGGVRHDDDDRFGGHTTLGGNFAFTPNGGRTVLRGTYAEGFRAPTLSESLFPFGNPALKAETSKSYDIGAEQHLFGDRLSLTATWFHRTSNDQITYNFLTSQSENIGRVRSKGVELTLTAKPIPSLSVEGAYSFVDSRNRVAGANFDKKLQRRPSNMASLSMDWTSPVKLKLGTSVRLAGATYDDAANTKRLARYTLVDLRASYPLTERVELTAHADNLFDETYETARNYSTLGRTVYAGVRVRY